MGKNKRRRSEKNILNNETKYESIIQKLSCVNKSNGLIIGTNAVLRLLQKNCLSVVFFFSNKACPAITRALSFQCKTNEVPILKLQEKDQMLLGSEFPVSLTYGIKKEFMEHHQDIEELLKNIKVLKKTKTELNIYPTNFEDEKSQDTIETVLKRKANEQIFHHKKHSLKKKKIRVKIGKGENFLAFSNSTSLEEFPSYKSVKWNKSEICIT